jgi:hypothetical protein
MIELLQSPYTIGSLIDQDMRAFLYCPDCDETSDIDLYKVADEVGRDWKFVGARWPVKCSCGNRHVEARIAQRGSSPK